MKTPVLFAAFALALVAPPARAAAPEAAPVMACEALADLQRALVLEPRHFEAWSAMGKIYESMDDKTRALASFRRALALYPKMEKVQEAVDRLAPDVDGRDL